MAMLFGMCATAPAQRDLHTLDSLIKVCNDSMLAPSFFQIRDEQKNLKTVKG